jgi:MFS family permease
LSATQAGALLVFMNYAGALPLLQADWGLSNSQAGTIQSAGQVGYLLAVLAVSPLTDFIDSKKFIVGGALWAGAANLLFVGLARDTVSASILRALVGVGIAGIYMPGMKLIAGKIDKNQRGRALGMFVASFTLGSAVSIALSGNIASLLGWRLAFGLTTFGPVLGAAAALFFLPAADLIPKSSSPPPLARELFHNRKALAVIFLYICHAWETLGLRGWLAAYLTEVRTQSGISLAQATQSGASVAGIATMLAALATAFVGAFSDRAERVTIILLTMAFSFVIVLILGASLNFPWLLVVVISLLASFSSNADSAVISTKLTEVVPSQLLGRVLAIYSFLGFLGGSISPLIFGLALDKAGSLDVSNGTSPWIWAFATLALGSLFGFVVAMSLRWYQAPRVGANGKE